MSSQAVTAGRGSAWSDPRLNYEQQRFGGATLVPKTSETLQPNSPYCW